MDPDRLRIGGCEPSQGDPCAGGQGRIFGRKRPWQETGCRNLRELGNRLDELHISGPLLRALRDAAAVDPELKALWDEIEGARLAGQGRFAGLLAERGALRPDVSVEQASDVIWTLCSVAVHDLLVGGRGWASERYEVWLSAALKRELLADD